MNRTMRQILNSIVKTIDGSQPVDIAGARMALEHVDTKVCKQCGTTTMVEDWKGSGPNNMHCFTCKRSN